VTTNGDASVIQLRRRRPAAAPVLLRTAEAAARLRVNESTVRRWVRKGTIPHVRLGDGGPKAPVRIPVAALDEWWQRRQEGGL
jgi:excisionase family DNA binding protein